MQNRLVLTKENVKRLEKELKTLVDTERKEVIKELSAARKQGDLSENAEYKAALEKQAIIENRINKIETVLRNSELAEKSLKRENDENIVQIGKRVVVEKKNGEKIEYKIGTVSDIDAENREIQRLVPWPMSKQFIIQTLSNLERFDLLESRRVKNRKLYRRSRTLSGMINRFSQTLRLENSSV
nr:transcription elongation factor GreA-like [Lytechinus pictus]